MITNQNLYSLREQLKSIDVDIKNDSTITKSIRECIEKLLNTPQEQFFRCTQQQIDDHQKTLQGKLKEMKGGSGFKRWFGLRVSKTIKHLEKLIKLLDELAQAHPIKKPKYDRQMILEVSQNTKKNLLNLQQKAFEKNLESTVLDVSNPNEDFQDLAKLTHRSRIYIKGHGKAGSAKISTRNSKNQRYFSANYFAKLLATKAPQLKVKDGNHRIKISLVVCHGAENGVTGKLSFAESFINALYAEGIDADVFARIGSVVVDCIGKIVDGQHKAPATKFHYYFAVDSDGIERMHLDDYYARKRKLRFYTEK
jgi:hypothetical protein